MPVEFWREVVDRVAAEVPDTLLLAEAFWMMEGYFVRTLGMHRVYNSAFMHMLRDEQNAEYRSVLRETVAFDTRILGRYVNFMNNPDERTAIDQFGGRRQVRRRGHADGDDARPAHHGHGQVEGFQREVRHGVPSPARDERPDEDLVARHEHDLFPLFRERWRFAGWQSFRQLTAFDGGHEVPDVFAFANVAHSGPPGAGERRSLVVYLNRYPRAHVRVPGVGGGPGPGPRRAGLPD